MFNTPSFLLLPPVLCQRPPQFAFNPSTANQFQPSSSSSSSGSSQSNSGSQSGGSSRQQLPAAPAPVQNFGSFNCPDDFGFYPHVKSCDKYWGCDNGKSGGEEEVWEFKSGVFWQCDCHLGSRLCFLGSK